MFCDYPVSEVIADYEDIFRYCVEEDPKQKLRVVAAPPQPGRKKFYKKVNATKPKKRKR